MVGLNAWKIGTDALRTLMNFQLLFQALIGFVINISGWFHVWHHLKGVPEVMSVRQCFTRYTYIKLF